MLKALVVDDDPLYVKSVGLVLDRLGYNYEVCSDGSEALMTLEANSDYNMLITDIVMPEMDGLELIKSVSETFENRVYIVAMSSGASSISPKIALTSASMYAHETLQKPFTKEQLVETLDKAKNFLHSEG